jgi:hypothetical protein
MTGLDDLLLVIDFFLARETVPVYVSEAIARLRERQRLFQPFDLAIPVDPASLEPKP